MPAAPPVDPRHLRIAQIVLAAVGDRYEVALGGGNSLMLHGYGTRFTEDVDFFVRKSREVPASAALAGSALRNAGYTVSVTSEEEGHTELLVHPAADPDGALKVEFAHFTYGSAVLTAAGPTVPDADQIRNKVAALFGRLAVRDYIDLAHILASGKYTLRQLIEMTREIDGLSPEAIADAGSHLPDISDRRIERYLTDPGESGPWVRSVLAVLPSTPEEVLELMGWKEWPANPGWAEDEEEGLPE